MNISWEPWALPTRPSPLIERVAPWPTAEDVEPAIAKLLEARGSRGSHPTIFTGLNRSFAARPPRRDTPTVRLGATRSADEDAAPRTQVLIGRLREDGAVPERVLRLDLVSLGSDDWLVERRVEDLVSDRDWGFIPEELWEEVARGLEELARSKQCELGLPGTGIRVDALTCTGRGRTIGWSVGVARDEACVALSEADRARLIAELRRELDGALDRLGWKGPRELRLDGHGSQDQGNTN